jgi:glycosyltransferase involved in cell wall biosynthesis
MLNVKKKSIIHIITRLMNGGADENTVFSCNHSVGIGDDVVLITGHEQNKEILSKIDSRVKLITVNDLILKIDPIKDLQALFKIKKIIKEISPDVVHTHSSKAGVIGRFAAWLSGAKLIIHTIHSLPFIGANFFTKKIYLVIEKVTSFITDKFINVSNGTMEIYLRYKIGHPSNHHVIYSAFDLEKFKNANKNEGLKELNTSIDLNSSKIIMRMGRFEKIKRYKELIETFNKILVKFPDVVLILVGDGELLAENIQLSKKLNLEKNIIFTGFTAYPEKIIALSDICIMNSEREGLSRAMLQYLAGGKPVICSNIYGVEEVMKDNINGCLYDVNDSNGLYNKLLLLLSNEQYLNKITVGAEKTDISNWSLKFMGKRINDLYDASLLAK